MISGISTENGGSCHIGRRYSEDCRTDCMMSVASAEASANLVGARHGDLQAIIRISNGLTIYYGGAYLNVREKESSILDIQSEERFKMPKLLDAAEVSEVELLLVEVRKGSRWTLWMPIAR